MRYLLFASVCVCALMIWTCGATGQGASMGGLDYTVFLRSDGRWDVHEGRSYEEEAVAWAVWGDEDAFTRTGWWNLQVDTNEAQPNWVQAYGAGYLEGVLTQPVMWDSFRNWVNGTEYEPKAELWDWVAQQDAWLRSRCSVHAHTDAYWAHVNLTLTQHDGMMAGYTAATPDFRQDLSVKDMIMYQMRYENGDIMEALSVKKDPSRVAAPGAASERAQVSYIGSARGVGGRFDAHCSSLVKLTADRQQLFAGQDTWNVFKAMLRVWKVVTLRYTGVAHSVARTTSFSSYAGQLMSGDDYYSTSAKLTVMETTNGIFNSSLYTACEPHQVPYWIRVIVANRMASDAAHWMEVFGRFNSGTYNNQWIVVDFKQFTPGVTILPAGTVMIGEQIPGYFPVEDKYWPSYNIPSIPFVFNISGYVQMEQKDGPMWSWDHCARANIFRRDQHTVVSMETYKAMMRYNEWQTDPLALRDACRGISARCDLNPPWANNTMNAYHPAFGATDSKVTSDRLMQRGAMEAVCGPTHDAQPPFEWSKQWKYTPHHGHPPLFAFDYVEYRMPLE